MFRFLLSPRWVAVHLAFLLVIAFCVVAGWWQFGVYQDSQTRHTERSREPVPVAEVSRPGHDIGAAADRPVLVEGTYLAEHQRLLPGRIHAGVLGWFVVVPVQTDDGVIIPVVRGWINEPADAVSPPESRVAVTGYLLPPETPDHATVRTGQVLESYEIAYVAPETVAESTGLSEGDSVRGYVLMSAENPHTGDVALLDIDEAAPIRDVNPWQNLSYWAQWWVFAVAGVVFWASAVRSGVRARRIRDGRPGSGVSEPLPPRVPS